MQVSGYTIVAIESYDQHRDLATVVLEIPDLTSPVSRMSDVAAIPAIEMDGVPLYLFPDEESRSFRSLAPSNAITRATPKKSSVAQQYTMIQNSAPPVIVYPPTVERGVGGGMIAA